MHHKWGHTVLPSMAKAVCCGLLPSADLCRLLQSKQMFDWPHLVLSSSVTARFLRVLCVVCGVCAVVYLLHQTGHDGQVAVAGKAGAQQRA